MAFNDINAWRKILESAEQEKNAYDKACEEAALRADELEQKEYDEIEQVQIDPATLGTCDHTSGCVCLDDLEEDEIDFSAYGISESDLGVGPADENYPSDTDIMKEPLVRLPAAKGRPVSTADLVAQNVVSLVSEAIKKIQEKKEQDIDEQDFDEPLYEETFEDADNDMLEEADDDTPAKVEDKIEQIQNNDDYPLSDADWAEINEQPSCQMKIQMIKDKIGDKWQSLSAEAKRQVRADIEDLRLELLKSGWSERKFKEALRLQKISKKRELTPEEYEKFKHIVQFDLDDKQRHELEKNTSVNGYSISREGKTTKVPNSKEQASNVKDYHTGEDAIERNNETGLDSEFDPEKYPYIPEPMEPGTEIPTDFDPNYTEDTSSPNWNLQKDMDELADYLKPGHDARKKQWMRNDLIDAVGEDFYTNNPKAWIQIFGALEPDEVIEIKNELINEFPPEDRHLIKIFLDYMFGDSSNNRKPLKLTQKDLGAAWGTGADQKGRSGAITQAGDMIINVILYAFAKYLNVGTDYLERFWQNIRSENTKQRNVRKEIRPILFNEICAELGVNLSNLATEFKVTPGYDAGTKEKKAADKVITGLFLREYDQMTPDEKREIEQVLQDFNNLRSTKGSIRKIRTGLNDEQNSEFQSLIDKLRDEGNLSIEDRIRLLQLYIMHKTPNGMSEMRALEQAEREYSDLTRNGNDNEFIKKSTQIAKDFLAGGSGNVTRDTIRYTNNEN